MNFIKINNYEPLRCSRTIAAHSPRSLKQQPSHSPFRLAENEKKKNAPINRIRKQLSLITESVSMIFQRISYLLSHRSKR